MCIVTSVQVEADEQKLTRLQTGTELVSAEEREKVEKVSAALPAGHARLHLLCATLAAIEWWCVHHLLTRSVILLQKFAANMEHWSKRRKIFKTLWCASESVALNMLEPICLVALAYDGYCCHLQVCRR